MNFSSPKGKKMHPCDFCDKLFSTASNMREHRRTHTGEKPFVCKYCGKAFAQSSTHSKHQLVHKSKEKLGTSREDLVRQLNREYQQQNSSELGQTTLAGSSTVQPHSEPSLLPSKTFITTLQKHEQNKIKMEVDFLDNLDWDNSNSAVSRQVDTSLNFSDIHDTAVGPVSSSFSSAKDNEQSSFADQKPVIIGMFKNRACTFSPPPVEIMNVEVKQEALEVREVNFESPSFLNELGLPGNDEIIQHEKAENKILEAPSLIFHNAKTINYDCDNKAFQSTLPQTVLSKVINSDNQAAWNEETPVIQLDLTSNEDTRPRTQDKFQGSTETFFKCIHCSETFSSLEEHICLAKEAKMFFKCQICQKTFSQYGPFFRHKQSHENPKPFTAGSSSQGDISIDKPEVHKNYESKMASNVKSESSDNSLITDCLYSRQQVKKPSRIVDVPESSFPSESSRIQSSTRLRDEEENSDDDVMIIEADTVQVQSRPKDILENLTTVEKPREKLSSIPTYSNINQFPNTEGGYFERPSTSTGDVVNPHRGALISETLLEPVVEKKTSNISHLVRRQVHLKKNLQPLGKKVHPFTCLFCPRKFSTASNMREHMRVHTGEKPFSCELCHKKFAQSSTRSKHMQTHRNQRMSGYLNGKKFTQAKNYKKYLRKPVRHYENLKSLLPNRPSNNKEKSQVHPMKSQVDPMKSSLMKNHWNKSDTNLQLQKTQQPAIKENVYKMLAKPNNFSFAPKTDTNKIPSLNTKIYRQGEVFNNNNNNNQFGYNNEGTNRINVSHEKTPNYVLMNDNNQTLKNKMSFPSVAPLDSHISLYGSSFVKSKTNPLPPSTLASFSRPSTSAGFSRPSAAPGFSRPSASPGFSRPNASPGFSRPSASPGFSRPSASPGFSRPRSRYRGAHRLLRNARSYRPFRCTYCPRTFSTLGNMKEHTRTHTGEKPFRCEYCHRCFAQSSTHSKHVQIHIRKQQLNCFFCGRFFSQVALLRNHIITEHKETAENSNRNNQSLSLNLCGSSNPGMANKNRSSFSFGSNAQSESFLDPDEKNQSLQNDKLKKDNIIELPDFNFEKDVRNYELGSSLTEKRVLDVDPGFRIQKKNRSFLALQESEANNCFPETSKRVLPEILKDTQESTSIAKDSSISTRNLSNTISETACVIPQLDSEMFEELLTKRAWLATSAKTRLQQQQSQIRNGSPSLFELAQIKDNNPELSPVTELDSGKSLAEDGNMYSKIKPLSGSSSEDLGARRTSLNIEEELNKCMNSGEQIKDRIYLNDYSYQEPLNDLSDVEIQADNKQKNLTKLQLDLPQNINKDNLMHYDQTPSTSGAELQTERDTNQPFNQYIQNKVSVHNNVLNKEKNPPHQQICSNFLKSDQQSSSSPGSLNNDRADHLQADSQIDTINKVGKETLFSLNNKQENTVYNSARIPNCEQSLPTLADHVEHSFDNNYPHCNIVEQNQTPSLISECSLNPSSGDATQKLNWILDTNRSETTTKREERTPEFAENSNIQILASNIENSLPGRSVAVLPIGIKLERNLLDADTEQGCISNVKDDITNFDLTQVASVANSIDSGLHFNISNITANAQYPMATEMDRNNIIVNNSQLFSEKMDISTVNDEANLPRICSTESSSIGTNANTTIQPKNVQTNSMANRENNQKDLPSSSVARKFKCVYCNRCFSSRSNMKEHMRIHTGEKPFECVFCLRRFAQSSTHSKHVQTHLHFRQLVCPQCGKRFLQANNLYQHIKIQHRTFHTSSATGSTTKRTSHCLDPTSPTVHSHQKRKSLNNKERDIYSADSGENNQEIINVPETSRQSETNNTPKFYTIHQSQNQTNEETSNDLSIIPIQLITSKDETTKSTIDVDLDKSNFTIDINDLPSNNSGDILPDVNEDPQFSSRHSITNSVQTLDTKTNLQVPSDTSFKKKSSDCNIHQETLAPSKTVGQTNDPHESNNHILDTSGNTNICESSKFQFKCKLCYKEFSSVNLLNLHQQDHIISLAERKRFHLKVSDIQKLERCIDFRKFLRENKIKSLDDLEESLEKVTADLGLKKLPETQCQAEQEKTSSEWITNKELSQDTESTIKQAGKNNFDPSHTLCPPSNQSSSDLSPFSSLPLSSSSSSAISPISTTESKKEQKKNSKLYFHRCTFCSKMFDALVMLQKHIRMHVKDDASSQSKYNKKFKECLTWYKHVEIVLGSKLKLPTRTFTENAQHLKVTFHIGERFKMLLHRNIYKCRQCPKECATFHSLLFHRHTHSRKLAGQKIPTHISGKPTKKAHGPSGFLHKRPSSSLIFCLEPIPSDNEGHSFMVEKQEESNQTLVPLLCFSRDRQFWLVNLNGTLTALGSYARCLPADKSLTTVDEIGSGKKHELQDLADSSRQSLNKSLTISCLEEGEEAADTSKKCYSNDKLDRSLNNLEDNDLKTDLDADDGETKDKGILMRRNTPSSDVNNSGAIKLFGQEVTTVVSLQFQNFADCSKGFTDVGHLKRKLGIHSRNFLFPCKFCPKSFSCLSSFLRHVNMIHSWNEEYTILNCRNDKPGSNCESNLDGLKESVKSKNDQSKTRLIPGVDLAVANRPYLVDLVKRVIDEKRAKVISDLPFAHRRPSEESKMSERMENPSGSSDKQPTESSVKHLSRPLHLQESNPNISTIKKFHSDLQFAHRLPSEESQISETREYLLLPLQESIQKISTIEKFQSENKESADEMNFVEDEETNKTTRSISVVQNFLTEEQQLDKEDEINLSSLDDPKAVYKNSMIVEEKTTVIPNETTFPSPSSHPTEKQDDPKHDSQVQENSCGEVAEDHLKENSSVECIFINDDPDDPLLGESCVNSSQFLLDTKAKSNTVSEIIVLSDEENDDDSTQDKIQIFNSGNSSINIQENANDAFLSWLKENQIEESPKADSQVLQDVYKAVGMSFKNYKPGLPEITGQKSRPNLNDQFGTVPTTSPLQISSIATNSSRIVDIFSEQVSYQSGSNLTNKVHRCLYCSKTCSSTSNLKEHMRSHTGERPFSCGVCHKRFAQKSTLSKHKQIHNRFRKLTLVGVNRQEASPGANPTPTEPTPTNSLNPPLTLAERSPLANQLKTKRILDSTADPKHPTLKSDTNCDSPQVNCDNFYLIDKNDSDIKSIISIEGDRPVLTQSSEIATNPSSSSHNHHHPLTSGNYPTFQNSADIFTYRPVFTNADPARPLPISYAVPETTRVSNKPYSCDICNRTFTTSGNLKEHRRTHTGERPFECPFCEKTFVQASTRSRHVKNHSRQFAN